MKCPKCNFDLAESEEEKIWIKQLELDGMTEEQRIKYVGQTLEAVAEFLLKMKGLPVLDKLKAYKKLWETKGKEILEALTYAVKPEFRESFIKLIAAIQEMRVEIKI